MNTTFRFSIVNILQILGVVAILWLVYIVRDVLIIVFLAWTIATALSPFVDRLERHNVQRTLGSALTLLAFFSFIGVIIYFSLTRFSDQLETLTSALPSLIQNAVESLDLETFLGSDRMNEIEQQLPGTLINQLGSVTDNAVQIGRIIVDSVLSIVVTGFLSFYFMTDSHVIRSAVKRVFSGSSMAEVIYERSEKKLRVWLRGQFAVMILIGVVTYIGLRILNVEFALPLAVLAGLLEIIPFIGPTISAIPAIIIGLADSPQRAVTILILYIIIQQLEATLVVPKVMDRAVGINPIIVIITVMVGSRLLGPIGALIAVPITAILFIVYEEWLHYKAAGQVAIIDGTDSSRLEAKVQ